jgi:large subunit ribosomal protein L25
VSTTRPSLAAAARTELGKANAHLRRAGRLPAVVYGHGMSASVSIDAHEFDLVRRKVGSNALVDLVVDGARTPVLVQSIQYHKIQRVPIHVDLFRVLMTEDMTVDVQVHGVGLSEAVERHGGTVFHALDHIKVRARPDNLPHALEADVSVLVDFESVIRARDVVLPEGVALVTDPDDIVLRALPPRVLEEAATAEEGVVAEAAPVVEGATE